MAIVLILVVPNHHDDDAQSASSPTNPTVKPKKPLKPSKKSSPEPPSKLANPQFKLNLSQLAPALAINFNHLPTPLVYINCDQLERLFFIQLFNHYPQADVNRIVFTYNNSNKYPTAVKIIYTTKTNLPLATWNLQVIIKTWGEQYGQK